ARSSSLNCAYFCFSLPFTSFHPPLNSSFVIVIEISHAKGRSAVLRHTAPPGRDNENQASTGKAARPGCRRSAALGAVFSSGHLANWLRTRWLGKQRDRLIFLMRSRAVERWHQTQSRLLRPKPN